MYTLWETLGNFWLTLPSLSLTGCLIPYPPPPKGPDTDTITV